MKRNNFLDCLRLKNQNYGLSVYGLSTWKLKSNHSLKLPPLNQLSSESLITLWHIQKDLNFDGVRTELFLMQN